jgi:hypothetical protein
MNLRADIEDPELITSSYAFKIGRARGIEILVAKNHSVLDLRPDSEA